MEIKINEPTDNPAMNIALDTIEKGKQALIFCSTKRIAESLAEKISLHIKANDKHWKDISEKALKVLSHPTKQCKRLSAILSKGIAFHHSGLAYGQRKIVEDNFRKGHIRIICCTPTLAWGLNLPAYRAVVKDLKRYGGRWGMKWISTLEYHQMAGRAGRPDFNDEYGEAICIASSEDEADEILQRFVLGEPEPIISKLAVEPVLRMYVLSLVSSGFARSRKELLGFFEKTFYAHQYQDLKEIDAIITRIIERLEEWEFIRTEKKDRDEDDLPGDFVSADMLDDGGPDFSIKPTKLGIRVSQLYIDPLTANFMIQCMRRATGLMPDEFSYIHLVCNTIELRPYFRTRAKELPDIEERINARDRDLIVLEPSMFEPEYDEYMNATKTALVLLDWMEEHDEEYILEKYGVRPGEFSYKKDNADWMLYAGIELAKILSYRDASKMLSKARFRLKHGIKEELTPLVKVKGIGRIRARKLYQNSIRDIGDIKKADITRLVQLIGKANAIKIKKEVGIDLEAAKVPEKKRKGQLSLEKYQDG